MISRNLFKVGFSSSSWNINIQKKILPNLFSTNYLRAIIWNSIIYKIKKKNFFNV